MNGLLPKVHWLSKMEALRIPRTADKSNYFPREPRGSTVNLIY